MYIMFYSWFISFFFVNLHLLHLPSERKLRSNHLPAVISKREHFNFVPDHICSSQLVQMLITTPEPMRLSSGVVSEERRDKEEPDERDEGKPRGTGWWCSGEEFILVWLSLSSSTRRLFRVRFAFHIPTPALVALPVGLPLCWSHSFSPPGFLLCSSTRPDFWSRCTLWLKTFWKTKP